MKETEMDAGPVSFCLFQLLCHEKVRKVFCFLNQKEHKEHGSCKRRGTVASCEDKALGASCLNSDLDKLLISLALGFLSV